MIPTILFNVGIPRIGSSLSALLGSMELPVAAIAAWLVLGEDLSFWKWVGIGLILIGIGIAELTPRRIWGIRRVWGRNGEIS
ncbi:EamA family transporter [Paenibacillus sp. sptzw28]|uniref:EamA family transporter n=1 Tax=Paenibacillus sp. sptzw28 TaxID=715179 RepID=UPI002161B83B|nr:EamA family transporter [Paenibacillus sp. sptzw28]